jgi:uncharacterized delta-60 repeat protein
MEEDAMPARFPRRPTLTFVGAVALVLAMANPAAAPPGDLDPTFDGDGKVTTDFSLQDDQAEAVAIQADGKIVAAGRAEVPGIADFGLARYNPDGSLDPTFGGDELGEGDGRVTTDFADGSEDVAHAVAIQADGKIVAAGASSSQDTDFALARYNIDGSLDPTFDGDGKVTTDFAGDTDEAFGVAIQADGKIVAAGLAASPPAVDFALARYNIDGSLDPAFDGDGKLTTDFAGDIDEALGGLAIQADGKIVAAGFARVGTEPGTFAEEHDFALARYNTDGSLDPTFSGDGKVTTDFAGSRDEAHGVAIQGDGKIVAAGFAVVSGDPDDLDFALARYNIDGSLDPTFDGDGKVTTDFDGIFERASAVAIQGDEKIVAAGSAALGGSGSGDFGLARYRTDGSLDPSFSGDGKVITDFGGDTPDDALGVAIQGDGKIVAAGFTFVSATTTDFALARYTCFRRTSRPTSIPFCP